MVAQEAFFYGVSHFFSCSLQLKVDVESETYQEWEILYVLKLKLIEAEYLSRDHRRLAKGYTY